MAETRVAYRIPYEIDGRTLEIDASVGTRGRVRALAQFMFKDLGYPIDQVTQTLLYRILRQGSLTTIAEELRRWKEEVSGQLRDADLPAPLLDASLALWRAARDEAERELENKRLEYAQEVEQLKSLVNDANMALQAEKEAAARQQHQIEDLKTLINTLRSDLNTAQELLRGERQRASEERKDLVSRIVTLESALATEQNETKRLREELKRNVTDHQEQLKNIQDWANAETANAMTRFDKERTEREEQGKKFEKWKEEKTALLAEEKAKQRDLAAQVAVLEVKLNSLTASSQRLADDLAGKDDILAQYADRLQLAEGKLKDKEFEVRDLVGALTKASERPASARKKSRRP